LVIHNLFIGDDDERVYAFSGLGLTEFYRSVSFWIGLSVPARKWAYGDGMSGDNVTADRFARSYVRSQYPHGVESVLITDWSGGTTANDPKWDAITLNERHLLSPAWSSPESKRDFATRAVTPCVDFFFQPCDGMRTELDRSRK
jgi:hypothetical protein